MWIPTSVTGLWTFFDNYTPTTFELRYSCLWEDPVGSDWKKNFTSVMEGIKSIKQLQKKS